MTEKERFVTIESGIDYGVIDTLTGERIFDEDITEKLNEIYVKVKESYNFGVDTKAKQLYTKTTVDDIIGIVKTDEPTDSVTLKKEAQLSICEKRLIELKEENEQLKQQIKDMKIRFKRKYDYEFDEIVDELW